MEKIIIMIILVYIVITIMSGPYDQNFIWAINLKIAICIKYTFSDIIYNTIQYTYSDCIFSVKMGLNA